ncbi:NO-inducible flavohemoprotein [Paenibacillus sp. CFBP13512]|uniref:NO-inducible flavohemoprotein n=1 Tax=Paenibacillus sp. CFBP13512 TaxID=2184007 RepID=UPI0010C08228|nr:NO-inducible flavohemoprotein [Paenibacillus sp. CFBP13512]TKJ89765.1 NO-inducible flavohemoprotein [Paenibacillus sp. CFBP13512]
MLDQDTIDIIKSTVPVLETEGVKITSRFYQTMFEDHPELLNIFNHANQKQGKQQAALANAVYLAAQHIDQLERILPMVKQVAHKHRSLGVLPEHYPIVGKYLLQAIQEVLGTAATPEILEAWGKAYGVIADAFIGIEEQMYQETAEQQGGWSDFRAFTVQRKEPESEIITSFYLVPQDGEALASFEPGQYISVRVQIPGETYTQIRQYSLSDAPSQPYYRISVKREDAVGERPAGQISNYLHQHIQVGDTLWVSAPAGDFQLTPHSDRPVVLLSAGVGLTPLISMLESLAKDSSQRPVTFIHATDNSNVHAMQSYIDKVVSDYPQISAYYCYTSPTLKDQENRLYHHEGYMDVDWLQQIIPSIDAEFYFCGPLPFMQSIQSILDQWHIPVEQRHYEFFGPAEDLKKSPL